MQAKLIAYGDTREQARRKLLQMLDETVLLGVASNRDFLQQIIAHPVFAEGHFSTGFIAEHFPAEKVSASRQPDSLHTALAAVLLHRTASDQLQAVAGLEGEMLNWQSSAPAAVPIKLKAGEATMDCKVKALGGNHYEVTLGDATVAIELSSVRAPDVRYLFDGVAGRGSFALAGDSLWLSHKGLTLAYADATLAAAEKGIAGSDGRLVAPMDGKIVAVLTAPGATIVKGQTLAVLEAMKMEFSIVSAVDGVVESVSCEVGHQVKARALLIGLKPVAV